MARKASPSLTEREAEIMDVVWRLGEATAEQVREAMPGSPHDSTVRTLLRVLENKGYVTHEVRGKSYVHRALIPRRHAENLALRSVLNRFFHGSALNLVMRLLEDEQLSHEQIEELKQPRNPSTPRKRRGKGEAS